MTVDVLALALAGHLIGDWVVQTDYQAANKVWVRVERTSLVDAERLWVSWKANQQHVLGYHLTMLAALAFSGLDVTRLALILSISWVTHSFVDRRWPVRWLMSRTGSGPFSETTWGVIAVDQALHVAILALLVAWR